MIAQKDAIVDHAAYMIHGISVNHISARIFVRRHQPHASFYLIFFALNK